MLNIEPDLPVVSPDHFKAVMRHWVTGVTVVTTSIGGETRGVTANSFVSVSLTPPLISITLAKRLYTLQDIQHSRIFAVNILSEHQQQISDRFAGTTRGGLDEQHDRFQGEPYHTAVTGAPILDRAVGYLDCRVVAEFDVGLNVILIGLAQAGGAQNDEHPLIYSNRQYWRINKLP
ncbi:MAG: flavin reductase family protein [Chloroflexi bacterium]|nr:flavin reductase family protein [Chloroflexota bacterium]MBI3733870.1 flavin reductase family protein [Chloroflexota bacterium]